MIPFFISRLILTSILLLSTISTSPLYNDLRCSELSSSDSCSCTSEFDEFEIQCRPGQTEEPKIKIKLQLNRWAEIHCSNNETNEYNILPELNIGPIPTIKFQQCPLPHDESIQIIFKRLGITKVNEIKFESDDYNLTPMRINFKGLDSVSRLCFKSKGFSKLPDDLFVDLKNLTWFVLISNKVILSPNTFVNLENITFLELANNNLQDLPAGIFRKQKRLMHLNLFSNNLQNLTKNVFEGASALNALDLSANNIESFESDVFSLLTNLTNINLNANHFKSLPVGLFSKNKNLSVFRLINNRIPLDSLPSGLLSGLPNLKEVHLSCDLKTLPGDLFASSSNIINLRIKGNLITTLPEELLRDQTSLTDLDLERNQLKELPDSLFSNARELIKLTLSHNQLVNISESLFRGLTKLEILYLNDNQLININSLAFETTTKLRYANFENNHINFDSSFVRLFDGEEQTLNSPFQYLMEMKTLLLKNNSITTINGDWMYNLLKMEVLDLSYNKISILSDNDLRFLSKNIIVNLTNNQISEISFQNIVYLDNPTNIYIDNNPLICNCEIMWFVMYLQELGNLKTENRPNIYADNLQCAGPTILKDQPVRNLNPRQLLCPLDVSTSSIKLCPNACSCFVRTFDKALIVNCSNSELTSVPNLPRISELKLNYTELHIENSKLLKLPARRTPGYSDVVQLYAANNNLTQINSDSLPANLKILDLSNNNLKFINTSILQIVNKSHRQLKKIKLSKNPWICDCNTVPMLAYFQENYKIINDYDNMKCFSGAKISEITPGEFCAVEKGLVIAVSVLIAMFGLTVGTLAALYYKFQQEIKVWLFAHNMCLWFVTEAELDKDKKYDAFISYSHKDEEFITDYLVPELENGPKPYKLCLHVRDWIVGEFIQNQIVRSVEESRRTIVILSPSFIESIWGRMEFRAAHTAALNEGRARVIVVIYGDIGDVECLDPELKAYLKMNTYVKWGDPWFWDKLRYAMPHPSRLPGKGLVKTPLKSSTDDKLELIDPVPITPPLTASPSNQANKNPIITNFNGSLTTNNGSETIAHKNLLNQQMQPQPHQNGKLFNNINGHINGAYIINTNAKQSDV